MSFKRHIICNYSLEEYQILILKVTQIVSSQITALIPTYKFRSCSLLIRQRVALLQTFGRDITLTDASKGSDAVGSTEKVGQHFGTKIKNLKLTFQKIRLLFKCTTTRKWLTAKTDMIMMVQNLHI